MKKIILGLVLLFLISCSEQKEPNYLKLIENCADSLSEKARKEEVKLLICTHKKIPIVSGFFFILVFWR
jgi:hypothetical protein